MKHNILLLGLIVVLSSSIISCSSKESQLMGKWSGTIEKAGETGTVTAEFFSDKTVNVNMGGIPLPAKWTILDDGRVKVNLVDGVPATLGTLQDKSLTLDFVGLGQVTLKKQ